MAIGIFYTEVIVVVKCAISNWPSEGHYFFEDLVEDWSLLTSLWWRLMSQLNKAPMKSMKRTFNGSMDSTLLKSKCPKERRTSYGGNQMSFPHCRPLAFVSLATFVIWDSVKTCQNHRDLTRFDTVCHVLHVGLGWSMTCSEECDARGKRIGGSQRPSNWENQL